MKKEIIEIIAEVQRCVDVESQYCNFKFEFPSACWREAEIPYSGATGIGILAHRRWVNLSLIRFLRFTRLWRVCLREFNKIVIRFYKNSAPNAPSSAHMTLAFFISP